MFKLKGNFISPPKPHTKVAKTKKLDEENEQNQVFMVEPFLRNFGSH